jgi:hypothetical protein
VRIFPDFLRHENHAFVHGMRGVERVGQFDDRHFAFIPAAGRQD